MKTLILVGSLMIGLNAWAMMNTANGSYQQVQNSGSQTYTIRDGYGQYVGHGPTRIAAASDARTQCIQHLVEVYEEGHNGMTPDPNIADYMIDACINK